MSAKRRVKPLSAVEEVLSRSATAKSGISALEVEGFKSLAKRTRIEIRPLTVLAGANSSGKSSAMQGLLLLKQTLDAPYDPGPLLLHNSHVKFTSVDQLLSSTGEKKQRRSFRFGVEVGSDGVGIEVSFRRQTEDSVDIDRVVAKRAGSSMSLAPGMKGSELRESFERFFRPEPSLRGTVVSATAESRSIQLGIGRNRCFLELTDERTGLPVGILFSMRSNPASEVASELRRALHLPGLRGNPERSYKVTAVGPTFSGTFETYVASVILAWQRRKDVRLARLDRALERLGLTWRVRARQLDATQVEILVGRLPKKSSNEEDLVNIADVGFGVSQVLPVVVALELAEPGQLVYIEQPEIHLHPRAESVMAELLAAAAKRGVKVVVETHAARLLLALQTAVAEGRLAPQDAILHWFERDEAGGSKVTTAELDDAGAYGAWPEDFGDVDAAVDERYIEAAERRLRVG